MNETNKCTIFNTQTAFIKNKKITIKNYIKNYVNKKKDIDVKLFCENNHELSCCAVNSKHMDPYFRHKNNEDMVGNLMTQWHQEWQSNFKNTEINF